MRQYLDLAKSHLSKLSIRTELYLFVAAFIVIMIALAAAVSIEQRAEVVAEAQTEIDDELEDFGVVLADKANYLSNVTSWLSHDESFDAQMRSRDASGLTRLLQPLINEGFVDSLAVLDADGAVLASVTRDQAHGPAESVLTSSFVKEALKGHRFTTLEQDRSGWPQLRLVMPISNSRSDGPFGVLVAGFFLDRHFVSSVAAKSGKEVAIVVNGQIAATTLSDTQDNAWSNKPAPVELIRAQRENRTSDFLTLQTDEGQYLFRFKPLRSADGSNLGLYGVGIAEAVIGEMQLANLRRFALTLLLFAFATALFGFILVRTLDAPIQHILSATRLLAGGDLASTIFLARSDELGEMARNLECLRQNVDKQLKETRLDQRRNAEIVRAMPVAAVITDLDHRISSINGAAERMLRRDEVSIVGHNVNEIFLLRRNADDTRSPNLQVELGSGQGTRAVQFRGRLALAGQPQRIVDVLSAVLLVEGTPGCTIYLLLDVTEVELTSHAKDEFLLNVAHELRAPLFSLRTSVDLLEEDYGRLSMRDLGLMVRNLQKSTLKFQTLVENLIDIGNIHAGRFRIQRLPIRIELIVQDAVEQVSPLLQAKGQQLIVNLEDPSECIVLADRRRIAQVIINLLNNASKYGPDNTPIELATCRSSGVAFVGVIDQGPGIPEAEQRSLFQPLKRDQDSRNEGAGMGIGLVLSKEIVEMHGGRIGLTSVPGQTTTFWFSLLVSTDM
jgi:signal transduction histidine kinase/HAMP domain-containing protein